MTTHVPHLSVVVASRNDDHGGGMLKRMACFIGCLIGQANRHEIDVELIVVEWNPPADRPLLRFVLPAPAATDRLSLRYIVVPAVVHGRWPDADRCALFQWMAKNVGIRRARGEYVLCTNQDILFSDAVIGAMRPEELHPGVFYRAVFFHVPQDCFDPCDVAGSLANAHRLRWGRHGVKYRDDCVWRRYPFIWRFQPRACAEQGVDADSSGDFTLMSRQDWMDIRGYPEIVSHAYVDGLICHAAVSMGKRQSLFPERACIYHLMHESGWGTMTPLQKYYHWQSHPGLDYALYLELVQWMKEHHTILPINDDNWGCAKEEFDGFEAVVYK